MAATYDPAVGTEKDWVRLMVGDRGPKFRLDDGEINAVLSEKPNKYLAAAACGFIILAQSRGVTSKSVDGLSLSFGGGMESDYRSWLARLQAKGTALQSEPARVFRVL